MIEANQDKFSDIARQVLAEYNLDEPRLAFIRHSDTVTYQVTSAQAEKFLLRLHVPVTSALGAHGADFDMVNSEMTWLLALTQDTRLTLQQPLTNRSGALVTTCQTADGTVINATLLRWIDGEAYHRDLETEGTAFQIGTILATLHNHAGSWDIPTGFRRPPRDIPYFEQMLNSLLPAVEDGRIQAADYRELSKSVSILTGMMSSLDDDRSSYGILHGDAQKGNMLYHLGDIRLIDFSFCSIGSFLFDLGICLSDMKPELHQSCLQGYQSLRELPPDYPRWIEGYFLGSIVGTFSFWVANPRAQEILARKVPQITRDFAVRFNQGEHFWFSA